MSDQLSFHLTPGIIDGAAKHVFTMGGCDALAIALHDATGWPIVAITDAHNVYGRRAGGGSALHWTVQHPDGKLLDIDGLHDAEDLVERYSWDADEGEAAWGLSTRADAQEWWQEAGQKIPLNLAATFVDAVLAQAKALIPNS